MGLTPGSGRSPGEGNGNLLQYSGLGNPMDREAWRVTDLAFTKGSAHNLATKTQQSVHTEKKYYYLIYTREIISTVVSILCYKSYCGLAQSHNLLTYELIFKPKQYQHSKSAMFSSVQFSSAAQPCPTLCDPMNCSTPGLLSITNSRSLLKLRSIESVMPPAISSSAVPFSSCPRCWERLRAGVKGDNRG